MPATQTANTPSSGSDLGCLLLIVSIIACAMFGWHNDDSNGADDAYVSQVNVWFSSHLKDPGSLDIIDIRGSEVHANGNRTVVVKYRAKNSFGALTTDTMVFTFSGSSIVSASQL